MPDGDIVDFPLDPSGVFWSLSELRIQEAEGVVALSLGDAENSASESRVDKDALDTGDRLLARRNADQPGGRSRSETCFTTHVDPNDRVGRLDCLSSDMLTGTLGSLALFLARVYGVQVVKVVLVEGRQGRVDGGSRGEQGIATAVGRGDQSEDGRTRRLKLECHIRVVKLDWSKRGPVREGTLIGVNNVDVFETGSAGNTGGRVNVKGSPMFAQFGLRLDRHVVLLPEDY